MAQHGLKRLASSSTPPPRFARFEVHTCEDLSKRQLNMNRRQRKRAIQTVDFPQQPFTAGLANVLLNMLSRAPSKRNAPNLAGSHLDI